MKHIQAYLLLRMALSPMYPSKNHCLTPSHWQLIIMKHIQAYTLLNKAFSPIYLHSRCGSSVYCSLATFGSELCTLGWCVRRRLDGGQQGCQSLVPGTNLCFCPPPPPPPHPLLLTAARGVIAMTRTTVQLPLG